MNSFEGSGSSDYMPPPPVPAYHPRDFPSQQYPPPPSSGHGSFPSEREIPHRGHPAATRDPRYFAGSAENLNEEEKESEEGRMRSSSPFPPQTRWGSALSSQQQQQQQFPPPRERFSSPSFPSEVRDRFEPSSDNNLFAYPPPPSASSSFAMQTETQQLAPIDPFDNFPNEPRVFIHEDSIVMIMKPKELAK